MKNYRNLTLQLCFLLIGFSALSACGQKGPIEIERPPSVQEDELEQTI
jgi:predicted small lipoprotein YifL